VEGEADPYIEVLTTDHQRLFIQTKERTLAVPRRNLTGLIEMLLTLSEWWDEDDEVAQ
jgi:hypothetical protein